MFVFDRKLYVSEGHQWRDLSFFHLVFCKFVSAITVESGAGGVLVVLQWEISVSRLKIIVIIAAVVNVIFFTRVCTTATHLVSVGVSSISN